MGGWYFALGVGAGSLWTLALTRPPRWRQWLLRLARPQYAKLTVTCAPGGEKIHAIKCIRAITGYGLKEAKEATEGVPMTLRREDAAELVRSLLTLGGVLVSSRPVRRPA